MLFEDRLNLNMYLKFTRDSSFSILITVYRHWNCTGEDKVLAIKCLVNLV